MPRIARLVVKGEPAVYHVMTRTALDGYVLGDTEKEFLFGVLKRLSAVYFAELLGFCLMGNHFHLLVRMHTGDNFTDEEIGRRFRLYHGDDTKKELPSGQIPFLRAKWENLSEFMREIKQTFSRYYNKRHGRRGFFWSERFKSVIVDNGETLINCLAYIDLNPLRAGLVERPEDYRWSSLGYHCQTDNKDSLLSLDFGLGELREQSAKNRLANYRRYVHDKAGLSPATGSLPLPLASRDRFRLRTRYFIDSGIIGSKEFIDRLYRQFKDKFASKNDKQPRHIAGLAGIYSLKRLSENI